MREEEAIIECWTELIYSPCLLLGACNDPAPSPRDPACSFNALQKRKMIEGGDALCSGHATIRETFFTTRGVTHTLKRH